MLKDMLQYLSEETDLIQEIVEYFKSHCGVYVAEKAKNANGKQVKDIQTRVENAVWRRDNYLKLLATIEMLLAIIERSRHFSARASKMEELRKIWKLMREMFQVLSVDVKDAAEMKNLPWERSSQVYNSKAKELRTLIHNLHGAAGFTTYIHIFLEHCGYLIDTEYAFCRFANYDIEGTHAVIKRVTKSITGKKNWAEHAAKRVLLVHSLPAKQSSRRGQAEAKARLALVGKSIVGKRRGRPSKGRQLHTLRGK